MLRPMRNSNGSELVDLCHRHLLYSPRRNARSRGELLRSSTHNGSRASAFCADSAWMEGVQRLTDDRLNWEDTTDQTSVRYTLLGLLDAVAARYPRQAADRLRVRKCLEPFCIGTLEALAVELPESTLDRVNAKGFSQPVVGLCAFSSLSDLGSNSTRGTVSRGEEDARTGPSSSRAESSSGYTHLRAACQHRKIGNTLYLVALSASLWMVQAS